MYADYGNKLIYLLDLCIFSYHLHSQTLIWPTDPYYEQFKKKTGKITVHRRNNLMKAVHAASTDFRRSNNRFSGPGNFSGTAQAGWNTNNSLDPIISDYDRINPWIPGFTRPEPGQWVFYNTPKKITDRIGEVSVARYPQGTDPNNDRSHTEINQIFQLHPDPAKRNQANDRLFCFEGGTGAIGKTLNIDSKMFKKPPAWSLMGFVLEEDLGQNNYNIFIVFRGSRSGSGTRAVLDGVSSKGNPDWVTDLDFKHKLSDRFMTNAKPDSGLVARGFRTSIYASAPNILEILKSIQNRRKNPPKNICVSGHSLGGALATHFTSAVICGQNPEWRLDRSHLSSWPWDHLQLVTYGAPITGDEKFASFLNGRVPNIVRCLLDKDPITSEKGTIPSVISKKTKGESESILRRLGHHAGTEFSFGISNSLIFDKAGLLKRNTAGSTHLHEPINIRRGMIEYFDLTGSDVEKANLLNNIPGVQQRASAISPISDLEPWHVFKSVEGLILFLIKLNLGRNDRKETFKDFKINFQKYLKALKTSLNLPQDKAVHFDNIVGLPGPLQVTQQNLETIFDDLKNIENDLGTKNFTYIAMCLLIIAYEENEQIYNTLLNSVRFNLLRATMT